MNNETQSELQRVVVWTMKAAAVHVDLAHFFGNVPDPDVCMGLRQSFEAEFDFDRLRAWGKLDEAMILWTQTFRSTVELLDAKARQVCELGATLDHQKTVKLNPAP